VGARTDEGAHGGANALRFARRWLRSLHAARLNRGAKKEKRVR
jgi:hypothetical protein